MKRCLCFFPMLFLAAGGAAILAGCSVPSISAEERTYALFAGLNAVSRDAVADNFLPDIADYSTLKDPRLYPPFWETHFPYPYAPYTVTVLDASNPTAVALTIASNITPPLPDPWNAPRDIILVMGRAGNDWFIAQMQMPPGTVIVQ